jgi:hypothetical protein
MLMVRLQRLLALGAALCASAPLNATTYPPVTFNELVLRADVIFVGEVADARPFPLQTREGTIVKTRVVFRVTDPIFGTASALETFDFLGGEWNGLEMGVAGMPRFTIGDRRVVFARRERSINPIVGFTQGLLHVSRDSRGVDRVFTLERVPLAAPESIGTRPQAAASAGPMALADFRARVARALALRPGSAQPDGRRQ